REPAADGAADRRRACGRSAPADYRPRDPADGRAHIRRPRDAARTRHPRARREPARGAPPRCGRRPRYRRDLLHLVGARRRRGRASWVRLQRDLSPDGHALRAEGVHGDGRRRDGKPSRGGARRLHPRDRRDRRPRVPAGRARRAARRIRVRSPFPRAGDPAARSSRPWRGRARVVDALGEFFRVYQTTIGVIGINALLALSVWITLYAGQLTLGNAAYMAIGAYGAALLGMRLGVPFPLGLVLGAGLSAALALPLGLAVFRLRGVYLAIATIGFGEVVRVVLLTLPFTGKALGLNGIPPLTELWHIYLSLAVVAYVLWRVQGSTVGRAWAAIREDEIAAASQGIAIRRYKLAAFVAGAAIAAWAGGLSAHLNFSIEPGDFGFTRAVQILVFAVVGGTPSVAGPIVGATLLTALPEILRPLKEYRDIFAGLILML